MQKTHAHKNYLRESVSNTQLSLIRRCIYKKNRVKIEAESRNLKKIHLNFCMFD